MADCLWSFQWFSIRPIQHPFNAHTLGWCLIRELRRTLFQTDWDRTDAGNPVLSAALAFYRRCWNCKISILDFWREEIREISAACRKWLNLDDGNSHFNVAFLDKATMQFERQRCTIIGCHCRLCVHIKCSHHIHECRIVCRIDCEIARQSFSLFLYHLLVNVGDEWPSSDAFHVLRFRPQLKCSCSHSKQQCWIHWNCPRWQFEIITVLNK